MSQSIQNVMLVSSISFGLGLEQSIPRPRDGTRHFWDKRMFFTFFFCLVFFFFFIAVSNFYSLVFSLS